MVIRGAVLILSLASLGHTGCTSPGILRIEPPDSNRSLAAIMANMENEMNNIYRNMDSIQESPAAEQSASRLLSLERESLERLVHSDGDFEEHSTMTNALESAIAQTERLLSAIQEKDRREAKANLDALDQIRRRCHSLID